MIVEDKVVIQAPALKCASSREQQRVTGSS